LPALAPAALPTREIITPNSPPEIRDPYRATASTTWQRSSKLQSKDNLMRRRLPRPLLIPAQTPFVPPTNAVMGLATGRNFGEATYVFEHLVES